MLKLLIGGSPCTHWSIAQTKNRETEPSGIGWELFENFLIALEKFKPDYFLYENNKSMSPAIRAEITKRLGVEPICINSALVSAQNRQRLYWTNIPGGVNQPEDLGILLQDILETGVAFKEKGYTLKAQYYKSSAVCAVDGGHFPAPMAAEPVRVGTYPTARGDVVNSQSKRIYSVAGKACSICASCSGGNSDTSSPGTRLYAEPVRVGTIENDAKNQNFDSQPYRVYSPDGKSVTLCGQGGGVGAKTGLYAVPAGMAWRGHARNGNTSSFEMRADGKSNAVIVGHQNRLVIEDADGKTFLVYEVRNGLITINGKQYPIKLADGFYIIRKLTVTECKRLQTVPDSYVFPVSDTQAYKMLGNGWTVDVIAHILSHCPEITTEPLDVLSMYDGMACGHIALDKLGCNIARYRATEIDKYAIKTACYNFPDIEQLGDAFQVREW